MQFINAHSVSYTPDRWLSYDDVLMIPKPSEFESRNDPRIRLNSKLTERFSMKVPIISANMDTVTGADMAIAMAEHGAVGILHRFYSSTDAFLADCTKVLNSSNCLAFSIGANKNDVDVVTKVLELASDKPVVVSVDLAHGHLSKSLDQIKRLKQLFGTRIEVIGGNVATPLGVVDLIKAGASAVKVGVGNGSMCTTRRVTGHGVPQLSAIMMARQAINSMGKNTALIADGGIRNSGDIIKALAAGADSVMVGNLFAATEETPGGKFIYNGFDRQYVDHKDERTIKGGNIIGTAKKHIVYKKYRGQSSQDFMNDIGKTNVAPEGESTHVPYKGSVRPIISELIAGLKSAMTYAGASDLEQLSENAFFIEISHHGYIESTPHGV